ncbi:MAG: hypothetical protein GY757_03325, partial [bacterium]|nr:hypothetical protein [bacterium]
MAPKESSRYSGIVASQYGKEKEYWLEKLSGDLGSKNFPYDNPIENERSLNTVEFEIPPDISFMLTKISGGSHSRLHMILVAGIVVLLYKYNNDEDILVGAPIYRQKIEGEFTNTAVVLRNQINEEGTFKELIIQVRKGISEAVENANYPIDTLLYHLNMTASESDFPLFDVGILLEEIHDKNYIRHIPNNMTFSFREAGDRLEGELEYNALRFEEGTIERIIGNFTCLLKGTLADVNVPIADISILAEEEKEKILYHFNDNRKEFPEDKTIFHVIEEHAAKKPEA